jgi:hypothetical protein
MSLLSHIRTTLRWSFSIGAKFIRVVPIYTIAVMFVTLISQIALLLAFFLPLKVIILLGSSGTPRYFPLTWQALERNHLIIGLAVGSVGFYLLYLLAEKMVIFCSERGAKHLLEKSGKITLFKNQGEIAIRAYHRYARSLSGAVFTGLSLVFIGFLYPELALVVLGYGLAIFLLLSLAFSLGMWARDETAQDISGLMNILGSVGFLLVFAFIVADFLIFHPPNMIVAIICFLLTRQLMNRVAGLISDLSSLFNQRLQINALFFHGQKLLTGVTQQERHYWSLFETSKRGEWVAEILREVTGVSTNRIACVWRQTGIPGVAALEIVTSDESGQNRGNYLIKVFNSNHRSLALHEASLMAECTQGELPALMFLGADQVGKYPCHIFSWPGGRSMTPREVKLKRLDVAEGLLAWEPHRVLIESYSRSREMLAQRLVNDMPERLHMVTDKPPELERLNYFEQQFDQIRARIAALPLQVVNPDIHNDTLIFDDRDTVRVTHWGRWSIDPVGSGWPVRETDLDRIHEVLQQVGKRRKSLVSVTEADIKLAALMYAFEIFYRKQKYLNAIDLLPAVIANI